MIPLDTLLDGAAKSIADADQVLLVRACELSPFFLRSLQSDAQLLTTLVEGLHRSFSADEMSAFVAQIEITDEATLKRTLRRLRKNVMLRLIARDLNGLADFAEVVAACSTLAELALNVAVQHLHAWQQEIYGHPIGTNGKEQNLIVVGMGKLGGGELNVSSDIDLIFAYAEDGVTDGKNSISDHEYFSRLGKKLIAAIGETTEDGFVFRVDMRLRPDGDSGPLVSSFEALEQYYQSHGREWERYAWIKGRVVAGESRDIERLLKPFVFRKYLDFGAIAAMRDLKQKIEREVSQRDMYDNIKLGRGGIREVEFVVQVFQLIRGGQAPELQVRPTLQALALLASKGSFEQAVAEGLKQAYIFLRDLEHRLQYLNDAQTQRLPHSDEDRQRIALSMDYANWDDFSAALEMHRKHVAAQFAAVFSEKSAVEKNPAQKATESSVNLWTDILEQERWPEAQQALAALDYQEQAVERLRGFAHGVRYRQLPALSQQRIAALMPALLQSISQLHNRGETLGRMLDLLEAICRRANYLALFVEYPQILGMVANICSASPWLSGYLTQHPVLLDELLDTATLYATPDFAALKQELEQRLQGLDVESQLDILRHFKHTWTFKLAAQDIVGHLPLETLSDYLSALADLLLDAVLRHAWAGLKQAHRADPRFALIAYGKLGGKEFGYASDVDVVFLYDDTAEGAGEIYARFAQRINHWLNSPTTAGILYETDLRLRPDGVSGLLVSSIDAFADYQRKRAWVWEHQALTRARFCAGDAAIGQSFETIRHEVLCQARDAVHIAQEVGRMRHKMWHEHPNTSGLFDIKHDPGGIVDVEFIVQTLVLSDAHAHPELSNNLGNIALLAMAGELGLIPAYLAQEVAQAYRIYRQHQHRLRLQGESRSRMERSGFEAQIASVRKLWALVIEDVAGVDMAGEDIKNQPA
ncbi:MAG TPA: bifunctional [glutamate--ammonia ligase]-adenylyl-L-tyrosine phosphorylase/[glutamate--ammonia-ligase] adenylyltransferase [Methylophilaceae bacterium]